MRVRKIAVLALALCLGLLPVSVSAAQSASIGKGVLHVLGIGFLAEPEHQTAPVNMGTAVNTRLFTPEYEGAESAIPPEMTAGLTVVADLSGPGISTPRKIESAPGEQLVIPPLPQEGTYVLDNIRLMRGEQVVMYASPAIARIDTIRKLLVTQVTSRALSIDEIEKLGISVTSDNFTAYKFTVGFGTETGVVNMDIPIVMGNTQYPEGTRLPDIDEAPDPDITPAPRLNAPNLQLNGIPFTRPEDDDGGEIGFLNIPVAGAIIIPGDIAFLNQFFEVMLLVTNNAPDGSALKVTGINAEIVLPAGDDNMPGSSDDPLRLADAGSGTQPIAKVLNAAGGGSAVGPHESGEGRFLVEGLREGTHRLEIKITATLTGLPSGPVQVFGSATGTVIVRNPNFTLTFGQPDVVRDGEEYSLFVTVHNTSEVAANLVQLTLPPQAVYGATIIGDSDPATPVGAVAMRTIAAGDSAVAEFRLIARKTGKVTSAAFAGDEGAKGVFRLRTGVDERGVPLSPDTIVLQEWVKELPRDLFYHAMRVLGLAHSAATAPVMPKDAVRIPKQNVVKRAWELSEAGLRVKMGETLEKSVADLVIGWLGSGFRDKGFEQILRTTDAGRSFLFEAGKILAKSGDLMAAQRAFGETVKYRGPFVSAVIENAGGALAHMEMTDADGLSLGRRSGGSAVREIPYSALIDMDGDSAAASGEMALVDADEGNAYDLKITGIQTGEINFGVILPVEGGGFVHVEYRNVSVRAGETITGRIIAGGAVPVLMLGSLEIGPTGTYAYEYPAGPRAVAAMQLAEADEDGFGRVVAVLFDEKVDTANAKKLANYGLAYRSEDRAVLNDPKNVKVFPGGRIVEVIFEGTVSPFFEYDLTISGMTDPDGNAQEPLSARIPVKTTIDTPGGIVSGKVLRANGEAIAHTQVTLWEMNRYGIYIFAGRTLTDDEGKYRLDFVKIGTPFIVESGDPSNGQTGNISSRILMDRQEMRLDIILYGLGTIRGQVVRADNSMPVSEAVVELKSLTSSVKYLTKADTAGRFSFDMVPVGNVNLNAARKEFRGAIGVNIPKAGDSVNVTLPVYSMLGDTGSLQGRVFASDGKTPMARVPVIVNAASYSYQDWRETDADGYYFFESVPQREISVYSFRQETGETARTTVTLEGNETAVVNLVFPGTAKLAGTVYDHTGAKVAGASVISGVSLVKTDENGNFVIEAVPTGHIKVDAQHPDTQAIATSYIDIGGVGELAHVALTFDPPLSYGVIQGYALDAHGNALRHQAINFKSYLVRREAYTDSSGFYSIELPLERYSVWMLNSDSTDADKKSAIDLKVEGQVINLAALRFKGFGRITGTIYQPDGESPTIASVLFTRTTFNQYGNPKYRQERYLSDQLTAEGLTGRFTIDKVLVSDFRLETFNAFNSEPVAYVGKVRNPDEVVTVDMVLRPTSVVRGQVFLADGNRAGADVVVSLKTLTISEMQVKTAADGTYRFDLVPPGTFTLEAYDPVTGNFGVSRCAVGTGDEAVVDIHILGRGTVNVSVVDGGGNPVANARVKLESGSAIAYLSGEFPTLVTGQTGVVTFRNVPEGGYSVTAEDPATLTGGKSGGSIPEDNIEMHSTVVVSAAGTVSGRVLMPDGVTPVPYAQVKLTRNFRPPFFTTSDAEGRYLLDYVPLGGFGLEVFHPATGRTGVASDTVDYDTQKLTVDIKLRANGTVEGYVLMSSGEPVGSAMVTLTSNTVSNAGAIVMTSNMEGRFKVSGIPEGSYTVTAQHPFWNIAGTADGEIKTEGETVKTDVPFEPTGTISGRTLAADGVTPVPYAEIEAKTVSGGDYAVLIYDYKWNKYDRVPVTTISDADGNFEFVTVPLGKFKLIASEQNGLDGGSVNVAMTTGDSVVNADIVFVGTGNIAGRVVNSDGTSPGRSVELALQVTGPLANSFTAFSDSDGNFAFYGVPAGDFSIYAHIPGSRLGGIYNGALTEDGETIGGVLIPIESSGEIKGTVFREDGVTPVQEALITCYVTRASGSGGVLVYALTDKSGGFAVKGIPLGAFRISAIDYSSGGIGAVIGSLGNEASTLVLPLIILDEHKPYVVAMRPKPGSIQVPLDSAITIQFSEPMDATLINRGNVRITSNGKDIAGALSLSPDRKSVTFTPASRLPEFAPVTVSVSYMRDDIGKSMEEPYVASFTTADITPPSVVSARLIKGAFVVEFSESVAKATATVDITRADTGEPVSGILAFSAQDMVVTFYPDNPLADATSFMFGLSGIADAFGNAAQDYSAVFSTGDKTAPVITLGLSSGMAIEGVPVTVTATPQAPPDLFVVDFSVNGQRVKSVNRPPYRIDISPTETITVSATPMDYAGNMGQEVSTTITVVPNNPPTAAILAPQTGTAIGTGQAIGVRVEASDDLGLKEIEMRVRSTDISDTVVYAVGTGALSAERIFPVSVPASSKSGVEISVEVVARDMRGVESAPARLLLHTIDKTPPNVEITSFKTGFNVSPGDSIPVNVFATDNETINRIEFRTEGGLQLTATAIPDAPASDAIGKFTLNVPQNYAGGTKIIVAPYAVDAAGNIGRARPVTLTVDDVVPPTVSIASPATGSSVIARDTVTARVRAADNDAVDRVEFFLSGKIFATDRYESGGYYETTFIAPAEPGNVELSAKAFDKSGKSAESTPLALNVVRDGVAPIVGMISNIPSMKFAEGHKVGISASFSDNIGISSVEFLSGGVVVSRIEKPTRSDAAFDYTIPAIIPEGQGSATTTLEVRATDLDGNIGTTGALPITVIRDNPPTVSFIAPVDGQNVLGGARINIRAELQDDFGVNSWILKVNSAKVAEGTGALVSASYDVAATAPGSTLAVEITAADSMEKITTATISLNVPLVVSLDAGYSSGADIVDAIPYGGYVYALEKGVGISVIDMCNVAGPMKAGGVQLTGDFSGIRVFDRTVYAYGASGIALLATAEPANPAMIGHVDTPSPVSGMAFGNGHAYAAMGAAGLMVLDPHDPASAYGLTVKLPNVAGVDVEGDMLNVAHNAASSSLDAYSIATPFSPVLRATASTGSVRLFDAAHDFGIGTEGASTLKSFTYHQASGFKSIQSLAPDGVVSIRTIDLSDGFVLHASGHSGWGMVGVSNNGMLSDMGMVQSGANVGSVFLRGGYIYSTEGTAGLKSYRIVSSASPSPAVSIAQPIDGASVEEGAEVEVVADVANGNSAVVTFFIDGKEVFADKTSPYLYRFRVPRDIAEIDLQAKVENLNGASALSGIVHLNVASETVPPSIALSSPVGIDTPLAMFEGEKLRIEGTATDKYGIEKVELYVDGVLIRTSRFPAFVFEYPVADDGVENTEYTLGVLIRATDVSGNSADRQFTVHVVEDNPPQISILSPRSGAAAYSGMTITIIANATDDRNLQNVQFFDGNALLGTGTASGANSYSLAWRVPAVVEDTLKTINAVATDNSGQTASASIAITLRPSMIGAITSVGSNAEAIDVVGNVAVTGGSNGLVSVYDVSVPASPVLLATLNTGYVIRQVRIIGNIVYVTEDGWRTWIVDISDPAHPVSLSSISNSSHYSVDAYDGLAFVGAYYSVQVFDVHDARNPVLIASKSLQGSVNDVHVDGVSGQFYAVADNGTSSYLYVLDVQNLSNIVEIGKVALSSRPERMEVTDGLVYVTTNSGLVIVDTANPSSPSIIATMQLPGASMGVTVSGNLAIVAGGETVGMSLIDVSAPAQPVYVASIDTPGAAKDVSVSRGLVYVADGAKGLTVVNAGDLPPVVHRDRISLSMRKPDGTVDVIGLPMAVEDESAYVDIKLTNTTSGAVSMSRITSGAAFSLNVSAGLGDAFMVEAIETESPFQSVGPVSLGRIPVGEVPGSFVINNGVQAVDASGGLAVTGDKSGNVRVFDVSDPANPLQLGTLNTGYSIRQVRIIGNIAYVTEDGWRTWLVDISDPAHPVSLSSISNSSHYSVDAYDGLAFVGAYYSVQVFDVHDARNPVRIASKSMTGSVNDVYVDGVSGRLYAVADNGTYSYLYVLDVRNLSNIVEVGKVKVNGSARRFELIDGKAFIAAKTGMAIVSLERLDTSAFGADGNGDGVADDVLSFTPTTGVAYDVAVQNGYAYVTDGLYNGIRVLEFADPSAPVEVGFIRTGGEPMDIDMAGATIFVGDSRGISVADTYLGAVPALDTRLIDMTVSLDATTVTVAGSADAVTDDVYPVIVKVQSGISGQAYTTTVAASDNGAFSVSLQFIANDHLSISLQESTPNPVTTGPFELGSIPVVPTLNQGLVRMELVPSSASVAVIGASGAVADDVYPVMVKVQSDISGQFYATTVAASDKGAFRINVPWLLGDRFSLTLQESTKNPVTVGPIDLGPIPVVPALNTALIRMQVDPSTSSVSVIGSAGAVSDDVYPVTVEVQSSISGTVYTTTVAATDNGAFNLNLPWLLGDRLSIALQESTPNPITVGPIDIGSIPVVPTLNTALIRMDVDPSTSRVSVIGSAGAVTDDVYPVTVKVQSGRTGQFYMASVAATDNGAFSVSLPWLSSDDISISVQESTLYPVTVGPVALGTVAALPLANVVRRVVSGSQVQAFDTSGGLAVSGDMAGHLKTYDVSNPENPIVLGDLATGYPIMRVRLIDNVAYVVYNNNYGTAFDIVDLGDPAHPAIVVMALDSLGFGSYCVDGIDDYSFSPPNEYFTDASYAVQVSGGRGHLSIYLSDPKMDWFFAGGALRYPVRWYPAWYFHGIWDKFIDIVVDKNSRYLYAMTDSTLLILDPFDGDILSEWGEIGLIDLSIIGHAKRLKLIDGYAYVATNNGVGIISLARLGTPDFGSDNDGDGKPDDIIGNFETRGPAYDMAIANGVAYVTDKDNGGISVVDISDPYAPVEIGVIGTDGEPLTVKAVGNTLYVGNSKGISVIEIEP
ncbi:MAG: Ig-like domain-containing protein [Nitrospirae bacterium]|nr:Ig-like domain-containing protein [Nitrospirota bacterium]